MQSQGWVRRAPSSSSVQGFLRLTTTDGTISSLRVRFRGIWTDAGVALEAVVNATGAEEATKADGGGGTGTKDVAATLAAKVDLSSVGRAANREDDIFWRERAMLKVTRAGRSLQEVERKGEGRAPSLLLPLLRPQ